MSEWERMTPRQLNILADAYVERRREELELQSQLNYSLACWIREAVWARRMPEYRGADGGEDMSDEEMYAVAAALTAAMGGEEADTVGCS